MYCENYGEYMRNQTNYPNMANTNPYYNMPTYQNQFNYMNPNQLANNLYPQTYQEIIQKIDNNCMGNDYRLSEENVERITEQIYTDFKDRINESKEQNQNNFIKDLIRIIIIKHLLSRQRPRNPYMNNMPGQMPFNNYMGQY